MRKLFRVVPIAIAVAFLVPAMTPAVAQAQSVDEQKQKVEDIVDQLERLEERALQIGQDYNDAIDTGSQLDVEIADAETRIAEKEADLAELRANLSDMALRSFVGGGAAPLGPLFEDRQESARQLDDDGLEERLSRDAVLDLLHHLFEEHAFMGAVLVDDDEPLFVLDQDVGVAMLTEDASA